MASADGKVRTSSPGKPEGMDKKYDVEAGRKKRKKGKSKKEDEEKGRGMRPLVNPSHMARERDLQRGDDYNGPAGPG